MRRSLSRRAQARTVREVAESGAGDAPLEEGWRMVGLSKPRHSGKTSWRTLRDAHWLDDPRIAVLVVLLGIVLGLLVSVGVCRLFI